MDREFSYITRNVYIRSLYFTLPTYYLSHILSNTPHRHFNGL